MPAPDLGNPQAWGCYIRKIYGLSSRPAFFCYEDTTFGDGPLIDTTSPARGILNNTNDDDWVGIGIDAVDSQRGVYLHARETVGDGNSTAQALISPSATIPHFYRLKLRWRVLEIPESVDPSDNALIIATDVNLSDGGIHDMFPWSSVTPGTAWSETFYNIPIASDPDYIAGGTDGAFIGQIYGGALNDSGSDVISGDVNFYPLQISGATLLGPYPVVAPVVRTGISVSKKAARGRFV